ncbi:unnamed protein product [Schistosoma curassoni]|uniref:DUF6451 domain-containing protein n=1 Tax=Schistosoma curassoni TaxID=6186 RepID=A0A183KFY3_9TREM|nr:unnamed protein product [Schistosoma curassoni]
MKTSTPAEKNEIQWTSRMQLDDLDFADDLALLSQTQQQVQKKTTSVTAASAAVGLNIHKGKSKILRYNTTCTNSITIDEEDLEDGKAFTYLGSIIDEHGGSDADVNARIGKARAVYLQLKNIRNSKQLSTNTKVRIFNKNVKTILLYGVETKRTTKVFIQKIQVFINSLSMQNTSDLFVRHYQQQPTVGGNKPDPIGGRNQEEALEVDRINTLRVAPNCVTKQALTLRFSRSKNTLRREMEIDKHEKNEQKLDRTRREVRGQSGLENDGRRPILHWE